MSVRILQGDCREIMASEGGRRPRRMPLWLAVVLNVAYGRPFRLCMHATDDPLGWVSCEVGDSFGSALEFHRFYRKLGYR